MASTYFDPAARTWRIRFYFGGEEFKRSLETDDEGEADAMKAQVERVIRELKQGRKELPAGADREAIWQFLVSDGKRVSELAPAASVTLAELFERYVSGQTPGAIEANSAKTEGYHRKHLLTVFGKSRTIASIDAAALQNYVNARARAKRQSRTIKKEISTFGKIWRWGVRSKLLTGPPPTEGLVYPKDREKEPFREWTEIESIIGRGGLTPAQECRLWECLFLNLTEVAELLDHVQTHAAKPFVYPMFVLVAHTGMRRSEMIRSQVEDIRFADGQVRVREKKREKGTEFTFRHVPMSPLLTSVMRDWLAARPGGQFTICQADRSQLTADEATHHFDQTLAGSKWAKLKGFHVLRHSFVSNLADKGIDQRIIEELAGHASEGMSKRYRHLFKDKRHVAIKTLFG